MHPQTPPIHLTAISCKHSPSTVNIHKYCSAVFATTNIIILVYFRLSSDSLKMATALHLVLFLAYLHQIHMSCTVTANKGMYIFFNSIPQSHKVVLNRFTAIPQGFGPPYYSTEQKYNTPSLFKKQPTNLKDQGNSYIFMYIGTVIVLSTFVTPSLFMSLPWVCNF